MAPATAPGSGLILVIDDAGAIQTAMQSLLEELGLLRHHRRQLRRDAAEGRDPTGASGGSSSATIARAKTRSAAR